MKTASQFTSALAENHIRLDCAIQTKKSVLELISELLAEKLQGIDVHALLSGFFARENLGSTSIGHGIAIPHCRFEKLEAPKAALIYLDTPLQYDEQEKIDIFCGFIVPKEDNEKNLQFLENVVATFKNKEFLNAIRTSHDPKIVHALLSRMTFEEKGHDDAQEQ